MKHRKVLLLVLMLVAMMLLLTACAPGDGANTAEHPAGFFSGVWHGWIAPVTLVISIFNFWY